MAMPSGRDTLHEFEQTRAPDGEHHHREPVARIGQREQGSDDEERLEALEIGRLSGFGTYPDRADRDDENENQYQPGGDAQEKFHDGSGLYSPTLFGALSGCAAPGGASPQRRYMRSVRCFFRSLPNGS